MNPERMTTDTDIELIVKALVASRAPDDHCRYDISPDDMREMFKFMKSWNETITDGKKTVTRTILVAIIGGLMVILGLGAIARIQDGLPK